MSRKSNIKSYLILSGICLMTLAGIILISCSHNTKKEITSTIQPSETYVPLETQIHEPSTDSLSVEHQLYTIVKSREKWQSLFRSDFDHVFYTVTDLDQNGRLELILSTWLVGTGYYTYNKFFEINKSGLQLVEYHWNSSDNAEYRGIEEADIGTSIGTVYVDESKNEYYYAIKNQTRLSAAENYSSINLWKYGSTDGKLERLADASFLVNKKGKLHETYRYFDKKGTPHKLSKKNYNLNTLQKRRYPFLKKETVGMNWIQFSGCEMTEMSDVQLLHGLQQSYDKFQIGKNIDKTMYSAEETDISFENINWQEMQYHLPEKIYRQLWEYLPVLQNNQTITDSEGNSQLLSRYFGKKKLCRTLQLADVTGDGTAELFLQCDDEKTVILSKQHNNYYLFDHLEMFDLSKTGLIEETFDDKQNERRYSKLLFEKGNLVKTILAKEICDSDHNHSWKINDEYVTEDAFDDWMEENWYADDDTGISPTYTLY